MAKTRAKWLVLCALSFAFALASGDRSSAIAASAAIPRAKSIVKLKLQDPLDLLVADLDGDGRLEIAVAGVRELIVLSIERGASQSELEPAQNTAKIAEKSRIAIGSGAPQVRSRIPLVRVALSEATVDGAVKSELIARSSEYARGVRLQFEGGRLNPSGTVDAFALATLGKSGNSRRLLVGHAIPGKPSFDAQGLYLWPLTPGPQKQLLFPMNLSTVRCTEVDGQLFCGASALDGSLSFYAASTSAQTPQTSDNFGGAALTSPLFENAPIRSSAFGTAFSICDLNRDGAPEVLTTAAVLPGHSDALEVRSWKNGALGPPTGQISTKRGIIAVACHESTIAMLIRRSRSSADLMVLQ